MKRSFPSDTWWLGLFGLAVWTNPLAGQVMLSPAAVVSTDLGSAAESASVTNMINQSGIETPFVSGSTVFDTYFAVPGDMLANSGDQGTNNWQSQVAFTLPLTGYVDFDLGATYQINKLAIWNRSLKDFTVKVRTELNGTEQVAGSYSLFSRLSFNFSYAPDVLSFATTHQARYVRLMIESTHTFSPNDTFAYAIIGEVVVSAAPLGSAVPNVAVNLEPNGGVRLTFTGTLQSATNVVGTFDDVPGNPASPYTLPKTNLLPQQYFRAKAN